jgi:hypothetical protein
MSSDDIEYYRRRAREERALAEAAANPDAARAHAELAGHYDGLIEHADLLPPARGSAGNPERPQL